MAALLEDLAGVPFQVGLANGLWSVACINDKIVTIRLNTRNKEVPWLGLRLDVSGYRALAPQGVFWDLELDTRLPNNRWPVLQENQAFRPDWAGGLGLYIACDRSALVPGAGHPEWANTHLYTNWRPEVGIARYLSVVSTLLRYATVPT